MEIVQVRLIVFRDPLVPGVRPHGRVAITVQVPALAAAHPDSLAHASPQVFVEAYLGFLGRLHGFQGTLAPVIDELEYIPCLHLAHGNDRVVADRRIRAQHQEEIGEARDTQ